MYSWLAEYLTELEMHRTQTEFDDSLTLKMYLLEFINYYASIFYIAFCKGKLVGYPAKYNRLFGYRQEEVKFKINTYILISSYAFTSNIKMKFEIIF